MLSRFSSLFVYVVAGLVISAAATPTGPPSEYDDGSKSPSYPAHPAPKYPQAYEKPPYRKSNDKYNSQASARNKAVSFNQQSCNVGKQQCCNTVYEKNDDDDENFHGKRDVLSDILSLLTGLSSLDLSGLSSDLGKERGPIGVNCSPMDESQGGAGNCTASPMCCNNNRFGGLIAFGCQSPLNIGDLD